MSYFSGLLPYLFMALFSAFTPTNTNDTNHLVQLVEMPYAEMPLGTSQWLRITFEIEEGYHIMASTDTDESFLVTKFTVPENRLISISHSEFSAAATLPLDGIEAPLKIFEHTLTADVCISVASDTPIGTHTVQASLFYQACSSRKCYFPRELSVPIRIKVR